MIKLTDLKPVSSFLELKHPITKKSLGVCLNVVGTESQQFYDAQRKMLAARIKNGEFVTKIDALQQLDETLRLVSSCIIGWDNDEFFGGEYSQAKVMAIIADPAYAWLKEQVDAYVSTRSNFFQTSLKPSVSE